MEEEKESLAETIREIQEEEEKEELKEEQEQVSEEKEEVKETEPPMVPVVPQEVKEEPKKKNKKVLIFVIISVAVLLIILAVVIILVLGGKKKYTITFDTAGGNRIASIEVKKGSTIPRPTEPTKEGYVFDGWEYNGSTYSFNNSVTSDMTLKAKWVVDTSPKEGDKIKVTFVYNNGDSDRIVEVLYGTVMKQPDDPVYEGNEFDGWYKDDSEYYFDEEVKEPFTLVAHWVKAKDNEYIINFSTDGGSYIESQTVKKGNKVVEPKDPTKEGYKFVEWQLNGTKYDFSKEVSSNLTLTAKWETNITVTFDSNGGSTVQSQKVEYGQTVTKPADPTKANATFDGWYLNDKKYNFEDKVTNSFTLKAKWIESAPLNNEVSCTMKLTESNITMDATIVGHLDSTGKINKVSYIYTLSDQETANLYCNAMKENYPSTTCSGLKVTIPDATKIQAEDGMDLVGMTSEQFITEAKKENPTAVCK